MADSDFYVGACPDCNATLSHVRAQNSSLGYSGTNAGGHLIIEDSEWDCNKVGILPNSLNNDDKPPPQNGLCPDGSGASCTFIQHNNVHDNNNPNVPCSGITCQAPIGTGIEISGGQHDTIQDNCVWNQCSWGIVTHDFPDTDMTADCSGGTNSGGVCLFTAMGNLTRGNTLQNNGGFGNQRTDHDRDGRRTALRHRRHRLGAACCRARVRRQLHGHRPPSVPARVELPAGDADPDVPASQRATDARPLRGRAEDPLVPVRRPAVHTGSRADLPGSRGALRRGSGAALRGDLSVTRHRRARERGRRLRSRAAPSRTAGSSRRRRRGPLRRAPSSRRGT